MGHYPGHTDEYDDWGTDWSPNDTYNPNNPTGAEIERAIPDTSEEDYASANFGGEFKTYGEEDLFTKITKGMKDATSASTYRPFFEIQREGSETGLLSALGGVGYPQGGKARGFEGSGSETSMYDAIMGDYGGKVMDYIGQMQGSAMEGQQRLDEIIRANKLQSFQLKQLEKGGG